MRVPVIPKLSYGRVSSVCTCLHHITHQTHANTCKPKSVEAEINPNVHKMLGLGFFKQENESGFLRKDTRP